MASEEMDGISEIPCRYPRGNLLTFDPLDACSNTDVNLPFGNIFSILRCPGGRVCPNTEALLRPGIHQVATGYALCGPSTMVVLTARNGVNGLTLDQGVGEVTPTHPNMTIPEETREFAIKASNMRWIASMVAEVHGILVRAGIFMHPIHEETKARPGGAKLRPMYEANPMSFIVEPAGAPHRPGARIMEIRPRDLHRRVLVILGSREGIERFVSVFAFNRRAPGPSTLSPTSLLR